MLFTEQLATRARSEMIEITAQVAERVRQSNVKDDLCIIYVPHTTAAVTINENADPDVKHDLLAKLDIIIPKREAYYEHAEGNSDSHLKASLTGPSVTLLIHQGRLMLGTWQGIQFCEFDGPRQRTYHIQVMAAFPGRPG